MSRAGKYTALAAGTIAVIASYVAVNEKADSCLGPVHDQAYWTAHKRELLHGTPTQLHGACQALEKAGIISSGALPNEDAPQAKKPKALVRTSQPGLNT
jgi:hypothetical protein